MADGDAKKEGGPKVAHKDTKEATVTAAIKAAKEADLGQVKIHKQDGTIQEERTYGKDPERSPG